MRKSEVEVGMRVRTHSSMRRMKENLTPSYSNKPLFSYRYGRVLELPVRTGPTTYTCLVQWDNDVNPSKMSLSVIEKAPVDANT